MTSEHATHSVSGNEPIPAGQLEHYMAGCRKRVPLFVDAHYSAQGAFRLNRHAWGRDLWIAPVNVLSGLPNFFLALFAVVLDLLGFRRQACWVRERPLGIRTTVQQVLSQALFTELLDLLPVRAGADGCDPVRALARRAAPQPVAIYLHTRNVAADLTAGLLAAIVGLLVFSQFTPGSLSAGAVIAEGWAREQAVSGFLLGEFLGNVYYDFFPVEPSRTQWLISVLAAVLTLSVVSAFAGFVHDPVQRRTGLHQRRLIGLLEAIERAMRDPGTGPGYQPKDPFVGRLHDLADWLKGLMGFYSTRVCFDAS